MRYPKHTTRRGVRRGLSQFSRLVTAVAQSHRDFAAKMGLSPLPTRSSQRPPRRGVLLLVILALLAMFGMVAVTVVVVASQARLAAEAHQRLDEVIEPPEKLAHAGLMQVLRGSHNRGSAIGPHSLLENVYGNNWVAGSTGGFQVWNGNAAYPDRHLISTSAALGADAARRRVGAVLTMTDGPARGASSRIVHYDAAGGVFVLLPFPGQTVSGANVLVHGQVVAGNYFISGVPFSGAGFGWNGSQVTDLALRPGNAANRVAGVQANVDYDAPDFQNMLLAAQFTDINGNVLQVIPSLHRPALVRYWQNRGGAAQPEYILRPMHGSFNGSNTAFNAAWSGVLAGSTNRWDVDNDGDGIADSIWVDLGFPARSSPGGRMVKPLFAILCVDLDGRLNVNAHGSLAQVNQDPWGTIGNYYAMPAPSTGQQFASGALSFRGQGYGPAEVNLGALFSLPPSYTPGYQALLTGGGGWYGRYGANMRPGITGIDVLAQARWFDYDYTNGYAAGATDAYGTPPDLQGAIAIGLDVAGRPVWDPSFCGQPGAENPYEMNPARRLARGRADAALPDTPFSATELERVLRGFDRDATTLPPRLRRLLELGGLDPRTRRHDVTTDSVDVPVPGVAGRAAPAAAHFADLLTARNVPQQHWATLFDPGLLAGRKMNLNRPLPGLGQSNYLEARQELARHLFCLAMLLRNPSYTSPWPADTGLGGNEQYLTVRRIAQWAVNVVDFLDADATMTPFQFDPDPFKAAGWTAPTGRPTTGDNLVWGMERPDLLLTETLAFHDRRVADTAFAGADDGRRTEQKNGSSDPPEAADDDLDQPRLPQGSLFVELHCTNEFGAKRSPDLYRLVGGQWVLDVSRVVGNSAVWRMAITEDARIEPEHSSLPHRLGEAPVTFSLETEPSASLMPGSGVPSIPIERIVSFAPMAPATDPDRTYYNRSGEIGLAPGQYLLVGPREVTAVGSTTASPPADSPQQIRLDPVRVDALDGTAYPNAGSEIRPVAAMIAGADAPDGWPNPYIGVSVSEPLPGSYYPPPSDAVTTTDANGFKDWYGDPNAGNPANGHYLDEPLDGRDGMPLAGMTETRTTQGYRYVLLQRLADPNLPHNPISNPYRTVDWMPIDLTVFNGQDTMPEWPPDWATTQEAIDALGPWDRHDPDPNAAVQFETRERAGSGNNLWVAGKFSTLSNSAAGSGANVHFSRPLVHSLGFLNRAFGSPRPGSGAGDPNLGDPQAGPFPWVTWNNRPFANPYELLMVPATTAARFGWEYTMAPSGGPRRPYTAGGDGDGMHVYDHDDVGFVHLMNFLHSGSDTSELHRIFDFLAVPSRFAGAHVWIQGATAPNHLMPTYREPGKVNLNTIFSPRVFRGLMNGLGEDAPDDLWQKFLRSRRGYATATDPSYPSEFAMPFRSAAASRLWPAGVTRPAIDREIEWTLLRSDPNDSETPLFAFDSTQDVNNTDRNPYFRNQGLMRLANATTTRSNVYAVWITVGFFEVSPAPYDADVYPDGWQIGRELGTDTGEIRRHRAFYIIDRSIPVGFQRGEDHNVEKTVLLRRFIE